MPFLSLAQILAAIKNLEEYFDFSIFDVTYVKNKNIEKDLSSDFTVN